MFGNKDKGKGKAVVPRIITPARRDWPPPEEVRPRPPPAPTLRDTLELDDDDDNAARPLFGFQGRAPRSPSSTATTFTMALGQSASNAPPRDAVSTLLGLASQQQTARRGEGSPRSPVSPVSPTSGGQTTVPRSPVSPISIPRTTSGRTRISSNRESTRHKSTRPGREQQRRSRDEAEADDGEETPRARSPVQSTETAVVTGMDRWFVMSSSEEDYISQQLAAAEGRDRGQVPLSSGVSYAADREGSRRERSGQRRRERAEPTMPPRRMNTDELLAPLSQPGGDLIGDLDAAMQEMDLNVFSGDESELVGSFGGDPRHIEEKIKRMEEHAAEAKRQYQGARNEQDAAIRKVILRQLHEDIEKLENKREVLLSGRSTPSIARARPLLPDVDDEETAQLRQGIEKCEGKLKRLKEGLENYTLAKNKKMMAEMQTKREQAKQKLNDLRKKLDLAERQREEAGERHRREELEERQRQAQATLTQERLRLQTTGPNLEPPKSHFSGDTSSRSESTESPRSVYHISEQLPDTAYSPLPRSPSASPDSSPPARHGKPFKALADPDRGRRRERSKTRGESETSSRRQDSGSAGSKGGSGSKPGSKESSVAPQPAEKKQR